MKNYVLIYLVLCFFSIMSLSCTSTQPSSRQPIIEQQNGFDPNKFGFSGIYLGMTYDNINQLVKQSPLIYRNCPSVNGQTSTNRNCQNEPQFLNDNIITGEPTAAGREWLTFDTLKPGEKKYTDYICKHISIQFHKGKVSRIALSSRSFAPGDITTELKDWGMRMLKVLNANYGKPNVVYIPIAQIDYFSFNPGFDTTLYEWNIKNTVLTLTIGTDAQKNWFDCIVNFKISTSKPDDETQSSSQKDSKPESLNNESGDHSSSYQAAMKGREYFDSGDYESCIIAVSKIISNNTKDTSAYVLRANAYLKLRQLGPAISDLNAAIEIEPNYAPAYNTRGELYESVGKYKEASIDYALSCDLGSPEGCANFTRASAKK